MKNFTLAKIIAVNCVWGVCVSVTYEEFYRGFYLQPIVPLCTDPNLLAADRLVAQDLL